MSRSCWARPPDRPGVLPKAPCWPSRLPYDRQIGHRLALGRLGFMRHLPRLRRSRRWPVAAALSLLTLALLAGCANPAGVDGDLTDGWAAIGVPFGFTPNAETCHLSNFATSGPRATY